MREAMFIKKNAAKWKKYQQGRSNDPDETARRFIDLMDDLAYARTYYPKSKLTRWINGIAAGVYQDIYRKRRNKLGKAFTFWKYDLPLLFGKHQGVLLFTFVTFLLFVIIGVFSSHSNPDFITAILSPEYVEMTERNISRGDPFGVYKDDNPFSMLVRIAVNNIRVAFLSFIGGFTAGIFTLKILWSNGLMLGSFQYLFFSHDLGLQSVLVIWIHGTIEIASLVIAGTAGFILAKGILFPATYTRLQSFRNAARDASGILVSLIPFFILAAFLESYITHRMSRTFETGGTGGIPEWVGGLILLLSFFIIGWYFIYYPIKLLRRSDR